MPKSCRMAHWLYYGPGNSATTGLVLPRVGSVPSCAIRCATHFLTEKELMTHLETLFFREIKRILRASQSEHGWTTGVSLISRDRVCVKSHFFAIPPTWDASVSSQQIYDTTIRRSNGRKVTLNTLPLKLTLTVKQTRAAQERTTTSFLSSGHLKGGADDLTLERLSLVAVSKLKQKATKPLRRLTACQVTHCITQSLYPISRITIGSNAAVFGVRWAGLWPCPKGATIYRDSKRVGETAEQQVERQVPGLTATERSVLWSACCGAWTGHKCRSDGSCLHCETGSRPTWEHMLVCTQLNFDTIDFSEIPQAIVDELRKTVETDMFAACAMMPKSYWTPPRDAPVEHEARLMAVRIFAKQASRKGIEYRQRCRELCLGDQRSEVVPTWDLRPRQRDAATHLADE